MAYWTHEQVEQLRELHATEAPFSQIAEELNMSREAVIGKAYRLKLPGRRPSGPRPKPQKHHRPVRPTLDEDLADRSLQARLKARRKPVDAPVDVRATLAAQSYGEPCDLLGLSAGHCKWPVNEGAPYMFCNAVAEYGPYCPGHCRLSYARRAS